MRSHPPGSLPICHQPAPWACWEILPARPLPWVQSLWPTQADSEDWRPHTQFYVVQGPVTATPPDAMASGEDESRSCVVCGDRATGYHFHARTCEGCKGFFRRTVGKNTGLSCPFAGSCKINKAQRRHCPACRLRKCLDAGMKKEMILSAEALAQRRARQAQRRARQAAEQLSQEQRALVQTLLGAHSRHLGSMFHQFVLFKPPQHLFTRQPRLPGLVPVLPLLTHFADINTFMVQQVVKFTKDLPVFLCVASLAFQEENAPGNYNPPATTQQGHPANQPVPQPVPATGLESRNPKSGLLLSSRKLRPDSCLCRSLPLEDQISLLKGATIEICHIALNTTFCLQSQHFLCGPLCYTIEDGAHVGFQNECLELLFHFHGALR
ncbi:nuclear receptor subfamily 1 group I member 3 isoform X2 [Rhinolophus ferrumequinum]|uniref:nuclear receptor subfamily 1 group I member 3 isoform X2 n=1 Tax=Rhinolophus ferrumequinum TaxID=59479 RepID=UPI00140FA3FE|nr:nuclear receptor subfamily 1 group I member 3 isoform X2 [Rhinolophus ferrumequinum]